jgi:nicotinamidase/pyrazinamidase
MKAKKALLIVDVQNDFCPGGGLAVPGGDRVVPKINNYIRYFTRNKLPILATRDWHPPRSRHFRDFGGTWPVHCIQNTRGAAFHPDLKIPKEAILVYKGMDPQDDAYSGFSAQDLSGQLLYNLLKKMGVTELFIAGLATDYCVKFTAMDALKNKFKVRILADAIKGVDLKPDDSQSAIKKLTKMGAKKIKISDLAKKTTVKKRAVKKRSVKKRPVKKRLNKKRRR